MKSKYKNFKNKKQNMNRKEIAKAFKWLASLSQNELSMVEILVRIEIAQKLALEFLNSRTHSKVRPKRNTFTKTKK
jgi:hypothetical protein